MIRECIMSVNHARARSVHSVEALLSALECCGVNNARIEIEGGGELPTLDGSAMVCHHPTP